MKVKFNKFERIAGLFVLTAICGSVFSAIGVAVKQGWFEQRYQYVTTFENADGVHAGTLVQMAGLRAGRVEEVELQPDNRIRLSFYIQGKFADRIRRDSSAQLLRPFIIGERILDVSVGTERLEKLPEGSIMASNETLDLMTIMSGKKLNGYLNRLGGMLENLQTLMEAFLSKDRTQSMVRLFDRIDPLMKGVTSMSGEVVKLSKQLTVDDNLKNVVVQLRTTTTELNQILPELNKENPNLGQDMAKVLTNLTELTEDFKVVGKTLQQVGPELPSATRRALEALNETVVLLKAMQKSFVLKGNVEDVRKEEAAALAEKTNASALKNEAPVGNGDPNTNRAPASR